MIKGTLYPGCKLTPEKEEDYDCGEWLPFFEFLSYTGEDEEENTTASVRFSTGKVIDDFCLDGPTSFIIIDECLENK